MHVSGRCMDRANSSSVFLVKRGHNSLPFGRYFLGNHSPLCSLNSSVFSNVLKTFLMTESEKLPIHGLGAELMIESD